VPGVIIDCNVIVPIPETAFFVVVPSNVPVPLTVNVRAFVAVVTVALVSSHTLDVIKDVDTPSAHRDIQSAVFMIFAGVGGIEYTCTVPSVRPVDIECIVVELYATVPDSRIIVAMPDAACLVLVPSNVPGPVIENVTVFVAVVTVLFPEVQRNDVINDVDVPFATMLVGAAVFMIFRGPVTVVTFTVP